MSVNRFLFFALILCLAGQAEAKNRNQKVKHSQPKCHMWKLCDLWFKNKAGKLKPVGSLFIRPACPHSKFNKKTSKQMDLDLTDYVLEGLED